MARFVPNQSIARRLGAIALSLIAAAVLFTAGAGRAAAAPPEVLASENPVVIPLNQNSKNVTLSWNLGNVAPKALLTVKDNTQAVVLNQPVSTVIGSTPLTATYGKSYTAQLSSAVNPAQTIGSPLTITPIRPPNDPNAPCGADLCITSVAFEPSGRYAPFTVKTNKSAHFEMQASVGAPLGNGSFAHVDSATFNLSNVTQWNSQLLNLEENTTYHYVLKATSAGGEVVKKTGAFKTLRRRAEVTFASIRMIEDSDILSACDCTFYFQAGNEEIVQSDFMYVSSGETIFPNVTTIIDYPPNSIRVRIQAVDEDNDEFPIPPYWLHKDLWSNGSDLNFDWSFVAKWVDVSLDGTQDTKSTIYTLKADDGPVKFTVGVRVKVTYVP